jgi:tetratricopeptide (TPR) repeat protein
MMLGLPGHSAAQIAAASMAAEASQRDTLPFSIAVNSTVTVHADRTAEIVETQRISVLTAPAIQSQSQRNFSYVEGMQTLEISEAYTEKPNGSRVLVDPASILTRDAASGLAGVFTRDLKSKTVIFPDVAMGDTLVMTTRREIKSAAFAGQFTLSLFYGRETPRLLSTAAIIAPKDLGLKVALYGEGFEHQIDEGSTTISHRVTYRPDRFVLPEVGETSPWDRDPRIIISTYRDYEELGRAFWAAASGKVKATAEIQRLADEITKDVDDRRAQAEAIDRWVKRNIRYVGVYLGTGRWIPNDAATVLTNKYGDCKDHATLMMALLAAKHIDSEYALINLGNAYTLPETVAPDYFNHVILHLPEFGLFDDPTVGVASFAVLAGLAYDKPVVIASAKGAHLARTPAMKPEGHVVSILTRFKVAADGSVTGDFRQSTTGAMAIDARTTALKIQGIGSEAGAERMLHNNGNAGKGRFEIGTPLALDESYVISGTFALNGRMQVPVEGSWPIPRGMTTVKRPGEFLLGLRVSSRSVPFICFAGRQIEEIEITVADELPIPRLLNPFRIENRLFIYQTSYQVDGRTLKVRREFVSRVPGQVCGPEVETEVAAPLKTVAQNLSSTRVRFQAPAATTPPTRDVGPIAADDGTTCLDESGDEAIAACTRAISSGKATGHDRALLYFNRGREYHHKGDLDRAVADYTQAIKIDPKYSEAYSSRGWSLFNRGDVDRAFSDYNEAIRLKPTSALALTRRGYAWYEKGDTPRAFADYDEAIRLGPERPYYERGNAWYDLGEFDRAIADYDQYISLHPDFANAYQRRGDAWRRKGELDQAIANYNEAISRNPADWSVYLSRGEVLEAQSESDRAIHDYGNAIRLNTKSTYAYIRRANLYFKSNDLDRALVDYSEALRLDPNLAIAFHGRGSVYLERGDRNHAIAELNEAIRLNPKDAGAHFDRGIAHLYDKALSDAVADFTAGSEITPKYLYFELWRRIAEWRYNPGGYSAQPKSEMDLTAWPGPVIRLLQGEITPADLVEAADSIDPAKKRAQVCEATFFVGIFMLQSSERDRARLQFQLAARDCPPHFVERNAANWELDALAATRRSTLD